MVAAVEKVGAVLEEHFPIAEGDTNELPDRLIEV
jgi:putative membrane protein